MTPILIFVLTLLSTHLLCESYTTAETSSTAAPTNGGTVLIRRRIPAASRSSSGTGGRYSLLNNRINRRPRKKNLDRDLLLDILGSYFDVQWMSAEEPAKDKVPEYAVSRDSWHRVELAKQLQGLNLSAGLGQFVGAGAKRGIGEVYARAVEKWLLKKASCPVRYVWEDIGPLFWPRYVRRGECASVPSTCSWPPGMHCVPSGTTTLHVLRWQCKVPRHRPRKNSPRRDPRGKGGDWRVEGTEQPHVTLRCSWIVVPYPVTRDCLCTC